MSKKTVAVSGGTSLGTLAFLTGTIVSFCTTPSFVGVGGLVVAAMVGVGAFLGSTIIGIAGGIAGAVAGGITLGLVGFAFKRRLSSLLVAGGFGALAGAVGGGISGSVYGAFKGYDIAKTALVQKVAESSFNAAAQNPGAPNGTNIAPAVQPAAPKP